MILSIARQGIHLFSVDMHPLTGKKRVAGTHFSMDMNALTGNFTMRMCSQGGVCVTIPRGFAARGSRRRMASNMDNPVQAAGAARGNGAPAARTAEQFNCFAVADVLTALTPGCPFTSFGVARGYPRWTPYGAGTDCSKSSRTK
jgi:hypothetical protein